VEAHQRLVGNGMELPTIPCQVAYRTDVSRMISIAAHSNGNTFGNY
jgi:hypothetical protein